jgi:hypothetical protein
MVSEGGNEGPLQFEIDGAWFVRLLIGRHRVSPRIFPLQMGPMALLLQRRSESGGPMEIYFREARKGVGQMRSGRSGSARLLLSHANGRSSATEKRRLFCLSVVPCVWTTTVWRVTQFLDGAEHRLLHENQATGRVGLVFADRFSAHRFLEEIAVRWYEDRTAVMPGFPFMLVYLFRKQRMHDC